jgi:phosphate/sulfate permease
MQQSCLRPLLVIRGELRMRPLEGKMPVTRDAQRRTKIMKTETIHHRSWVRLLVIVSLATCAFAAGANAQTSYTGKFTLPHEAHWGSVVLPAGSYSIKMDSLSAPALVWSVNGETKMFTTPPMIADSEKGTAAITMTVNGNERIVRSLNLPELGKSFTYKRLTKAERELFAKTGQIETVPVVIARK